MYSYLQQLNLPAQQKLPYQIFWPSMEFKILWSRALLVLNPFWSILTLQSALVVHPQRLQHHPAVSHPAVSHPAEVYSPSANVSPVPDRRGQHHSIPLSRYHKCALQHIYGTQCQHKVAIELDPYSPIQCRSVLF